MRGNEDREHQRHRAERLVLQEDEHPPRRIEAPLAGEGGIARIVGNPGGADRDMRAQPDRPQRDQRRDQPLPRVRRRARHRPQRAPAPIRPSAKVQIVSTQPELPVRCCTTQATAIRTESETR